MVTPIPHAQWIDWAPAVKGVRTVWATTPTPKMIRVKVPRNSADSSPSSVLRLTLPPCLVAGGGRGRVFDDAEQRYVNYRQPSLALSRLCKAHLGVHPLYRPVPSFPRTAVPPNPPNGFD